MIEVEVDVFQSVQGSEIAEFDTFAEADDAPGQTRSLRRTVKVPAEYVVMSVDGDRLAAYSSVSAAAVFAADHAGATITLAPKM